MANAFTKRVNSQTKPQAEQTERQPSEMFINIGFKTIIEGEERFVNIPVVITADNIEKGIENVKKSCGQNSPEEWKQFTAMRVMLGEDIKSVFEQLEEGTQIVNKDIPENDPLAYLQDLEVQFVRRNMHKETVELSTENKEEMRSFLRKK